MKLNSISIGGGLALVAVGLLANAAASLVGSPDKVAHADDLKRAAKNPQPIADVAVSSADEMRRAMDGTPPTMPMGAGDGCVEGEPLNWFGEIRELTDCQWLALSESITYRIGSGGQPIYRGLADINNDLRQENWVGIKDYLLGDDPPGCLMKVTMVEEGDGNVAFVSRCVFDGAILAEWVAAYYPSLLISQVIGFWWFDIDSDADQDLVLRLSNYPSPNYLYVWLENTGYEATQPLVGDLDGDGSVGASDLTMLLGGWTGN